MRNLSAQHVAAASNTVTIPGYLVRINTSPEIRLSTFGTVLFGGEKWLDGVAIDGVKRDGSGIATARLTIPNHDNAWSALILTSTINNQRCEVWEGHMDAAGLVHAQLVLQGALEASDIGETSVSVQVAHAGVRAQFLPRLRIGAPLFNHITPPGTIITWGGVKYTLEARNG